jgi:hypothetical protein
LTASDSNFQTKERSQPALPSQNADHVKILSGDSYEARVMSLPEQRLALSERFKPWNFIFFGFGKEMVKKQ